MSTTKLYLFDAVILPVILATIAHRLAGDVRDATAATVTTLGAAVLGMWAATLSGTGAAIGRMRSFGLLEPVVAAPLPLSAALASNALASSALGIYAMAATLGWARLALGLPLHVASPTMLVAAAVTCVFSTAALGLVLSVSLVLYPRAHAVSNIFEYPIWLLTGAWVPLGVMPDWVDTVSWVVGPAWGMKSIRAAVAGDVTAALSALVACAIVTALYWLFSVLLLRRVERLARERATLPLS
ncbi:hypothetical protein GCM10017556_44110 [Micromonospora sagamiensis]|nr:ABC transporter permease [Micromonospora sagamiensis]BCL16672.1 hypothetical protein GCM10017556_44110 [Micromonospora sagamiensis]